MRLMADGRVYVIEANPNPWLAPEAELAIAARLAGREYVQLIGQIVEMALADIRLEASPARGRAGCPAAPRLFARCPGARRLPRGRAWAVSCWRWRSWC